MYSVDRRVDSRMKHVCVSMICCVNVLAAICIYVYFLCGSTIFVCVFLGFFSFFFFFFQAEDGIRDPLVTGVQTCALPIWRRRSRLPLPRRNSRGRPTGRCRTARRPMSPSPRRAPAPPGTRHAPRRRAAARDRKSTRLNSSHEWISYAVFCLKKKTGTVGRT